MQAPMVSCVCKKGLQSWRAPLNFDAERPI